MPKRVTGCRSRAPFLHMACRGMQGLEGDTRAHVADCTIAPGTSRVRAPEPAELDALLGWLDRGLRDGRRGRLRAEYPTALDPARRMDHHVVWSREGPLAHALARRIDLVGAGRTVAAGLIGLVYTDPDARGRGLARACVEASLETLRARGARLVLLWSDLDGFYTRLGFQRAGFEWCYRVDAAVCVRARRALPGGFAVNPAEAEDWPWLEALYACKPVRAARAEGELARLAAAPACAVVVARRAGRPCAYAACGRGDDLQGVIHEWAGEPAGVLACIEALLRGRREIGWMVGPVDEAPAPTLRRAGAARLAGDFAWVRLLDAERLFQELADPKPDPQAPRLRPWGGDFVLECGDERAWMSHAEAVAFLLGPRRSLIELPRRADVCMSRRLPWPMFLWGFDSV